MRLRSGFRGGVKRPRRYYTPMGYRDIQRQRQLMSNVIRTPGYQKKYGRMMGSHRWHAIMDNRRNYGTFLRSSWDRGWHDNEFLPIALRREARAFRARRRQYSTLGIRQTYPNVMYLRNPIDISREY